MSRSRGERRWQEECVKERWRRRVRQWVPTEPPSRASQLIERKNVHPDWPFDGRTIGLRAHSPAHCTIVGCCNHKWRAAYGPKISEQRAAEALRKFGLLERKAGKLVVAETPPDIEEHLSSP